MEISLPLHEKGTFVIVHVTAIKRIWNWHWREIHERILIKGFYFFCVFPFGIKTCSFILLIRNINSCSCKEWVWNIRPFLTVTVNHHRSLGISIPFHFPENIFGDFPRRRRLLILLQSVSDVNGGGGWLAKERRRLHRKCKSPSPLVVPIIIHSTYVNPFGDIHDGIHYIVVWITLFRFARESSKYCGQPAGHSHTKTERVHVL